MFDFRELETLKKYDELKKARKKANQKIESRFATGHHRRISRYFHNYTEFINFGTFMYVAHRNFVSVFDLKNKVTDIYHLRYDDQVVLLTQNNEDMPGITVLLGNNELHHI